MCTPPWFYRRPFFWWALAATGAVLLTFELQVPLWGWSLTGLAACMAAGAGLPELGASLAIAALFGARTVLVLSPPAGDIQEGTPVTLRGMVARTVGISRRGQRVVFDSEWRLTPSGWISQPGRFGLTAPLSARPGDVVQISGTLRRPTPATNPGASSPRIEWLRRGVHYLAALRPTGYTALGHRNGPWWEEASDRLRDHILELNRRTLPPSAALIANDFLIGDAEPPDADLNVRVRQVFRDSGTIHLLVVSGTQVTLVLGVFVWLGWRFFRLRRLVWPLGLAALGAFYLTTGGEASVTRAAVMGGVVVLGLSLDRELDVENCLGLAALALLLPQPLTLFDVGGQLSFVAVWSLVRLGPVLYQALGPKAADPAAGGEHWSRAVHSGIAGTLASCIAAHLGTAPLLAFYFQRSAWIAVPANLVMLLLASGFTYLVIAHLALASIGLPLLAPLARWGADALYGWAWFFARPPLGAADVFPAPLWMLPLCLGAVAAPSVFSPHRLRTLGWTASLAGALFLSERLPAPAPAAPTLRAFDVGQGDSLLLEGTDGGTVLVDGGPPGPRPGYSPVVRALRALRISALDAVVVSHGHADHVGGLPEVLESLPVRLLIHKVHHADEEVWERVLGEAERQRIPVFRPEAGDRIAIRSSLLTFLGPSGTGPRAENPNAESLVVRWDSGGARFLLVGDAGVPEEAGLLRWGPQVRADVLKVGHHGSRGATGTDWLRAVRPRCAVISCGRDNHFGHPAPETLNRLRNAGAPVARTDQGGMITVQVRGGKVEASSYVPE